MRLTKVFSLILALLGVAAIASLVPLLDAFAYAQRNGGILLVLSFMILLIGMGVAFSRCLEIVQASIT